MPSEAPAPTADIRSVSKAFGGVQALSEVSFDILPGEVHALVGENGAGKSTLIKILAGAYLPDAGEILTNGSPLRLGSVRASEAAGIAVIHQESTAFPHLDAADNIFIGREPRRLGGLLLDRPRMWRDSRALMETLGQELDLRRAVGELPVAQRQMVAMARALSQRCRLLVMDEPTASLSARETGTLFRIIAQLRDDGVSILYVSHRLEEVFALASRVTVLRDGRLVGTRPVGEVDRRDLIRMMVGREVGETGAEGPPTAEPREALLAVQGLTREGVFRDISFCVGAGEIVGLAGLVGAGRSEVARAIFGIDRPDAGIVTVRGWPLPRGRPDVAMECGLALVPEDRQTLGLILPMSVGRNLTLTVLRALTRFGFLSSGLEDSLAEKLIDDLGIRAPGPWLPAEDLSGGNQQKVVLGKWLATSPRLLILDEPTRGIDVGAKAEVHRLMRDLAGGGVGLLLISSELPEIVSMSDRIIVMRNGLIAGELPREEATQERVLELALPPGPGEAVPSATSAGEQE